MVAATQHEQGYTPRPQRLHGSPRSPGRNSPAQVASPPDEEPRAVVTWPQGSGAVAPASLPEEVRTVRLSVRLPPRTPFPLTWRVVTTSTVVMV